MTFTSPAEARSVMTRNHLANGDYSPTLLPALHHGGDWRDLQRGGRCCEDVPVMLGSQLGSGSSDLEAVRMRYSPAEDGLLLKMLMKCWPSHQ